MKMLPEVGDTVTVKEYAYTNKQGGTSIIENVSISCVITKAWHDYECGWRYHAKPLDKKLPMRIFISEFDIVGEKAC